MKKFINVLCVLLALFICVACLSGCNNQNSEESNENKSDVPMRYLLSEVSNDDIVKTLKENGFDAYVCEKSIGEEPENVIVVDKNDTCYLMRRETYENVFINMKDISENTQTRKILKTILPLFGVEATDTEIDVLLSDSMRGYEVTIDNKVCCMYFSDIIGIWDITNN